MVRAVTKSKPVRALTKGQAAILLPGPTGAEPWELWVLRGKGESNLVQVCQTTLANKLRKTSTLLLPVSQVYCLPLWLNETDPKLFAGMIPLQLELRGLQPRNGAPAVFDSTVVTQEGSRTLVLVGVLPPNLPEDLHAEAYESFDLSARYFPLPENTLTIWREHDRLTMAITRGPQLVYFQVLAQEKVTARVVQDIICAHATLAMQDIVGPLQKILVWTEISPEETLALKGALPLPIEQEDCPPPVAVRQPWKLVPVVVGEARRARANRQWFLRALAIFVVLYLAILGLFAWEYLSIAKKADDLRKWQTDHADALTLVEKGRSQWKDLAPVVSTKDYPLELLLEACQSIPADQLHLTLFEAGNAKLRIKGEAKNPAAAFQFFGKLKADPYFAGYSLNMASPNPLPNDLSAFQIEGDHVRK